MTEGHDRNFDILKLESYAREGFKVRKHLVTACDDLIAGILLSQIMYWYLDDKDGKTKLRVIKEGRLWLAKKRTDWKDEVCINPKQYDRAIKILIEKDFVEVKLFKFNAVPTPHIYLKIQNVTQAVFSTFPKRENGLSPNGKMDFDEKGKSLTEITNRDYKQIELDRTDNQENQKPKTKNPLIVDPSKFQLPKEMLMANDIINRMVEQKYLGNLNVTQFADFIETNLKKGVAVELIEHLIFNQVKGKANRVRYYETILDDWVEKGIKIPEQLKSPKTVEESNKHSKPHKKQTSESFDDINEKLFG